METFTTITTGLLLIGAVANAQDQRTINGPVQREITGGGSHSYTIVLAAGDYLAGSIDQQGVAVYAAVFLPAGTRMRGLPGPREGKRDFAFIADTAGAYRHGGARLTLATSSSSGRSGTGRSRIRPWRGSTGATSGT